MKTFLLHPDKIKIREGLDRVRVEQGELLKLSKSIKRHGQIQPIVITEKFELVAGGRRLQACALDGTQVLCIFKKNLDDLSMRMLELEENFQRKDFTPAEECQAIREIHLLKIQQHGDKATMQKGSVEGWGITKTAEFLGITRMEATTKIKHAEAVDSFPELKEVKTHSELKSAHKALNKTIDRVIASQKVSIDCKKFIHTSIQKQDAVEFMKELKSNSVDLLLTDPPYGIDIQKVAISTGGRTGKLNTSGYKFDDGKLNALALYNEVAKESYRFTKATGHAFVFVAPEFFTQVRSMFLDAGWLCNVKPIIWIKNPSGQCNAPHAWPASCYDMILYTRKKDSALVVEGQPDWLQCNPVPPSTRTHPTEKPVPLLEELIRRTTLPGDILVDPFMGSGSSLHAGLRKKLKVSGCDILEVAVATAKLRIDKFLSEGEKSAV